MSFSEIFDQIKIAIIDQPFIVRLMPQEGAVWGVGFIIHERGAQAGLGQDFQFNC